MDIDEFLERDIARYLDELLQEEDRKPPGVTGEGAFLTRDYEEEFLAALDRGNVAEAKRVLHDLKGKFDEHPAGTPEKRQLKLLLTDLYERFKDHLDGSKRPESHGEHAVRMLDEAEHAAARGERAEAVRLYRKARQDVLAMKDVPEALAKRFSETFKRIKSGTNLDEQLMTELERLKGTLREQLDRHDLPGAMRTYRKMRLAAQQVSRPDLAEDAARKLVRIYEIVSAFRKHNDERNLTAVP